MKKKLILILILTPLIIKSQNIQWKKVLDIDSSYFVGIDNPDTSYCMAIAGWGPFKSIYKSTNAGDTWNYVLKDPIDFKNWHLYKDPFDIAYPTRDFCVVSCDSNVLYRTKDGGKTWDEIRTYDLLFAYRGFFQISMLDAQNGLAIAHKGLAITHNGFDTFETFVGPNNYFIDCADLAAPFSICVVSENTKINPRDYKFYRSDDGGKNWKEYDFPDYSHPNRLKFVDSLTGYLVGQNRTGIGDISSNLVYKTIDGGKNWFNVLDTVHGTSGLQQLDFLDKDNGIVVGQWGYIYWTHDGGNTWLCDSSDDIMGWEPPTIYVSYIRKDRAIIVDFVGRIFISEIVDDVEDEIPIDADFVLYPNPATDKIKIRMKDEFYNSTELQIFNNYGQKIINISSSDFRLTTNDFRLLELDISSLSNGVYFAVLNGSGKVRAIPFVVLR